MRFEVAQCVNKGMQRDYSMDKASQEFAYENQNIRITTTGNNSFLSVTNEKSTTPIKVVLKGTNQTINLSTILGSAVIKNTIVLFYKENEYDVILKGTVNKDPVIPLFEGTFVYKGKDNLKFDVNNPIECIVSYEGDAVQKIYWVDGINQPRVVNICNEYPEDYSFDFVPEVNANIDVNIQKEYLGNGHFKSGVIQYYITYYKKYGAESNAVYQSPLYYISPADRGGEINEDQTCSFKITITPKDNSFDYVRVYSVVRNALNAEPVVSIVGDYNIYKNDEGNSTSIQIIDTNDGTQIAPTDVLFLGGNTITAETIEQKDNTLFLGNISSKNNILNSLEDSDFNIKELVRNTDNVELLFGIKAVKDDSISNNSYYPYVPNMNVSSFESTTFKYGEWYRFGIQFQLKTLEWSPVYYVGDIQNNVNPSTPESDGGEYYNYYDEDEEVKLATMIYAKLYPSFVNSLISKGFVNWRLMIAQHTPSTRTIKAQGLVLPTIFNLKERQENTCYASPIWSIAQTQYGKHLVNADTIKYNTEVSIVIDREERSPLAMLPNTMYYNSTASTEKPQYETELLHNLYSNQSQNTNLSIGAMSQIELEVGVTRQPDVDRFYARLKISVFDGATSKTYQLGKKPNREDNSMYDFDIAFDERVFGRRKKGFETLSSKLNGLFWSEIGDYYLLGYTKNGKVVQVKELNNYEGSKKVFIGEEVPSGSSMRNRVKATGNHRWHYPAFARDFSYNTNEELLKDHSNNYFLDANICNFISPDVDNIPEDTQFRIVGYTNIANSISDYSITTENNIISGYHYEEGKWNFNINKYNNYFTGITSYPMWPYNNALYFINYWNQGGHIIDSDKFKIVNKKFANMWYLSTTNFLQKDEQISYGNIYDMDTVNSESTIIDNKIYKADYENILFPNLGIKQIGIKDNQNSVNETLPLSKINSLLEDNDTTVDNIYSATREPSSLLIDYNTEKHVVFKLPKEHGLNQILPNYATSIVANNTIFNSEESIRQVGYIASAPLVISLEVFKEYVKDKSYIDISTINHDIEDGIPTHKVTINLEGQPTSTTICYFQFDSFISIIDQDNNEVAQEHPYNNKGILLCLTDEYRMDDYGFIHINLTIDEDNYYTTSPSAVYYKDKTELPVFEYIKNEGYKKLIYLDTEASLESKSLHVFRVSALGPYISKNLEIPSKLWIGEFYTPYDKNTFMGGNNENAIEQNVFIPVGGEYSFEIVSDDAAEFAIGYGLEGDTYYQRWDYLRTKPKSEDSVNQNKDAVSVMLETYKNLDGDYREIRGRLDTINLTSENTNNVLNNVYNQTNNYITSSVLDNKFDDYTHPTLYTWSLSKQNLADVDNWTSINLASSLKLDGDKGALTKIKRWNDKLLAFQEKGLAIINFNQQTTISKTDGVPVEIANSGKVSGHYYISSNQGCLNKWSIIDSPYGIYFIDSNNKSINILTNDGIKSLSTINLFQDWIIENDKSTIWNPNTSNDGFKSFYDSVHKEVYFVNNKTALCYNELLGQFTSFYDYPNLNSLLVVDGHVYGIKNNLFHKMFEGTSYCNLFNEDKIYSMTYKINKDSFLDKTWTNIEYRADIFNEGDITNNNSIKARNETFDTLDVWNEYQYGKSNLNSIKYPNAKNKFRIWRYDIPRAFGGRGLDRIRNPWIMIKLSKTENTNKRMEFHDLLVKYLQ